MPNKSRFNFPTDGREQDIIDRYARLKIEAAAQDARAERERIAKAARAFWKSATAVISTAVALFVITKFF